MNSFEFSPKVGFLIMPFDLHFKKQEKSSIPNGIEDFLCNNTLVDTMNCRK